MSKPIIALTLDYETNKEYSKFPWYAIRENYFTAIEECGGIGIGVPHNTDDASLLLKKVDGLLITGGNFDINPNIFGENNIHSTVKLKEQRTKFEMLASEIILNDNKPLLGICGGEQLINVLYQGTLIQHIPDEIENYLEHEQPNPKNEAGHSIYKRNARLKNNIKKTIMTNSFISGSQKPGKGLVINAFSEDGVIEGIEDPSMNFCIGVQWHPEFFIQDSDKLLLKAFINSC